MAPAQLFLYVLATLILPLFYSQRQSLATAQFIQGYYPILTPNGVVQYWRPTVNDPLQDVIEFGSVSPFLVYNCYLMQEICTNANAYFATPRGQNRAFPFRFGYDLNTGKRRRSGKRRNRVCPTGKNGWAKNGRCPELNQQNPMRHDGQWYTHLLEPGTTVNGLANRYDSFGNLIEESKIRYSCDEFPPATWIEGGAGFNSPEAAAIPAQTRCAAMRCGKNPAGIKVKAEQDWQGTAHGRLREELKTLAAAMRAQNIYPNYDPNDSILSFQLRLVNEPLRPAAAWVVIWDSTVLNKTIAILQAKRSAENVTDPLAPTWADLVTGEDVLAAMDSMPKSMYHEVLVNDTTADMPALSVSGGLGSVGDSSLNYRSWDGEGDADQDWTYDDDEDDQDVDDEQEQVTRQAKPAAHALNSTGVNIRERAEASPSNGSSTSTSGNTDVVLPLLRNVTAQDIEQARRIVREAMDRSAVLNKARFANPIRNKYSLKPGTVLNGGVGRHRRQTVIDGSDAVAPQLLEITDTIAAAAALLSEVDSAGLTGNLTAASARRRQVKRATSGTYWMEHLDRKGTVPWGDDANYKIFRNVLDYGAVGDGLTDDTKAIKRAMDDGRRCGEKCNGSTLKNAIVYFPPGTYLVSSSVPMPFGTQVIGDANNRPTIVAGSSFVGLGVLSSDEYTGVRNPDGSDEQWYINTANFYRQIRNIRIDISKTKATQNVAGVHWQVAQATSIQNVELIAAVGSKNQYGIFAENGSGGVISDIVFRGGAFGLYGGEQQFTAQRMTFDGCATGVQIIWDWGWVWKSITMTNVDVGFRLLGETGSSGSVGSAAFYDSSFQNVGTAVLISPANSAPGSGSTGVIVENVAFSGVGKAVADTSGKTFLAPSANVDHWALGTVYSSTDRQFSMGGSFNKFKRPSGLLDAKGAYYERAKPQYESSSAGDFVHIKDLGARGDGITDDTVAFQNALYSSLGKILFIDAGSYILTGTITIPRGSKIVGETWSQLVAAGAFFEDAKTPKVLVKVGNPGDVGDVEMQDIIVTTSGPTAGAILIQWNIEAASAGSAALWDVHVRIGGATGTKLTPAECPALTSGIAQGCNAASLMMHITSSASGYFENMWLWVADHMIDDPDLVDAANPMVQTSIYVARGLLVESVRPVWLYGTASEHAVFYQYNFHHARNVFAGLIQTESPYYQPTPQPPAPFQDMVNLFTGDPDYKCAAGDEFNGCDQSWAVMMRSCANVLVAGAGIYTWFSTYTQTCISQHNCQKVLILFEENYANVRWQNFVTIGAKYMAVMDGVGILALDNLNVEQHPRWSLISVLDVSGDKEFQDVVWIDPKIWAMETPRFTCAPPCVVKIPPWTGATSTVDVPILTITQGTWSTAITKAPLTISQWVFEVATLKPAGKVAARQTGQKRQVDAPFTEYWPVPATVPAWPAVTYQGPGGVVTSTTFSVPFPTLPSSIGPNAAAPPMGSWPKRAVQVVQGGGYNPYVKECGYADYAYLCNNNPLGYGTMDDPDFDPEDPYDEMGEDAKVACPTVTRTTTEAAKTTIPVRPTQAVPVPAPLKSGNPMENKVSCYNQGRGTEHSRIDNAIDSFCKELGKPGDIISNSFSYRDTLQFPQKAGELGLEILVQFNLQEGCEWRWDLAQCQRYLKVVADSCDCSGVNSKHGGSVKNSCYYWRLDPNTRF